MGKSTTIGAVALAACVLLGGAARAADFEIRAKAPRTGVIVPSGTVEVFAGDTVEFTMAPVDPAVYAISDVVVDGESVGPVASWTFADIDASHRIKVRLRKRRYAIELHNDAPSLGDLAPSTVAPRYWGRTVSLSASPVGDLPAYLFVDGTLVAGSAPGESASWLLTVTADHVVTARFGWPCANGGVDYPACTPPPADIHVSAAGSGLECSLASPCALDVGLAKAAAGNTVHVAAGTYPGVATMAGKAGTAASPVTVVGAPGATIEGGIVVDRSSWVVLEGLRIVGEDDVRIEESHYVTVRGCELDHVHAGVSTVSSSHLLVEDNDIHQHYPPGSTWTDLKGSEWEGGGFYASSSGQGMYVIRGNDFHDCFNGVYLTDDDEGAWMNANVFVHDNSFRNVVDDPFEPEGDSFNVHFFGNTLLDTHRMVSLVPASTCLGPVFVYGNVQDNDADPTGEAASGRLNSMLKLDTAGGECPGGIHVFHNTVRGTAGNFHGLDLLSSTVRNLDLRNNVFVTELDVCSSAPTPIGSTLDYNLSDGPFGYVQANGLVGDPLLQADGSLGAGSPALGAGTAIVLPEGFATTVVSPAGSDLGAFVSFAAAVERTPPEPPPADFPATEPGWPDLP